MSKSPGELAAQIALTKAFIDADYTDIVLTSRRPHSRTATGGTAKAPAAPLPPQRVKIIDQSGQTPNSLGERTVDGTESVQTGMVLGLPSLVISEGDTFTLNGFPYVIATLYPANDYEVRAQFERHNPRGA